MRKLVLVYILFPCDLGTSLILPPTSTKHVTPFLFRGSCTTTGIYHRPRAGFKASRISRGNIGTSVAYSSSSSSLHRFDKTSSSITQADHEVVIEIDGHRYNLTSWAQAHPGGEKVLHKFHNKDATRAFDAARHSAQAKSMLAQFAVDQHYATTQNSTSVEATSPRLPWKVKLFTKEDPIGVHKYLGVFCLLHFAVRFGQMLAGDPSASLGQHTKSWVAPICLIPHALLSLSSLMFHTVPRERVTGKPMIWKEYRVHNIVFGLRSVVTAFISHLSLRYYDTNPKYYDTNPKLRPFAVWGSCLSVLLAQLLADLATKRLRAIDTETTTATMPYWDGCSIQTQRRFKSFYAYSQFMATLACLAVMNPVWPLAVLLAIQGASFLMTLVRKGLLSAKGYHYCYTATLILPYLVGFRSLLYTSSPQFLFMLCISVFLYEARRRGVNKYALWLPVIAVRVTVGDRFLCWKIW